jgi:hypothetical protein
MKHSRVYMTLRKIFLLWERSYESSGSTLDISELFGSKPTYTLED